MPWYYAGPEAKPVGPISVEELHACRARGLVKPETYVIEHTGQPVETLAWRRYQEIFPLEPVLPTVPAPQTLPPASEPTLVAPPLSAGPAPTPAAPPSTPAAHPLFPSAAPAGATPGVFPPGARPDPYYNVKPTNGWCAWGFGLALLAIPFSCACGTGLFPALLSLPLCVVGIAQVHKNREQGGQGMAIAGLILATFALIISLVIVLWLAMHMNMHGLTITEQTTNDSE